MLHEKVKKLAQGPNYGVITTLGPDGAPESHVVWVDADDEHVLVNTEVHRRKFKNAQLDPRVSVVVWDAANPYSTAEVRGRVVDTVTGQRARDHIDELSRKYEGVDYFNPIESERVIVVVEPERTVLMPPE